MIGAERGIPEEMAQSTSKQPGGTDLSPEKEAELEAAANAAMRDEIAARKAEAQQEVPEPESGRKDEYLTSKLDSAAFIEAAARGREDLAWTGQLMRASLEANIAADLERRVRGGHLDNWPGFSFPPEAGTFEQKLQWARSTAGGLTARVMEDTRLFKNCGRLVNSLREAGLDHDEADKVVVYTAVNEVKTRFPDPFGIRLDRWGKLNDPADGLLGLVGAAADGDVFAAREADAKLQNLLVSKRQELAETEVKF